MRITVPFWHVDADGRTGEWTDAGPNRSLQFHDGIIVIHKGKTLRGELSRTWAPDWLQPCRIVEPNGRVVHGKDFKFTSNGEEVDTIQIKGSAIQLAPNRSEITHALAVVQLHMIETGDYTGARKVNTTLSHFLGLFE